MPSGILNPMEWPPLLFHVDYVLSLTWFMVVLSVSDGRGPCIQQALTESCLYTASVITDTVTTMTHS